MHNPQSSRTADGNDCQLSFDFSPLQQTATEYKAGLKSEASHSAFQVVSLSSYKVLKAREILIQDFLNTKVPVRHQGS